MNNLRNRVDPVDGFDLGDYRWAVAKFLRFLICARVRQNPDSMIDEEYHRWDPMPIRGDQTTVEVLLAQAAAAADYLWMTFIGPNGSGGLSIDVDLWSQAKNAVLEFTIACRCVWAGCQQRGGAAPDLEAAFPWDMLGFIRDELDKLPVPLQHESLPAAGDKLDGFGPNVFRRQGSDWVIRYSGGPLITLRDLAGAMYIHHLLSRPGVSIGYDKLIALRRCRLQGDAARSAAAEQEGDDSLAEFFEMQDAGPVVDKEALAKCHQRLNKIRDELEEARELNDESAILRLEDEQDKFKQHLREATRPGGALRMLHGQSKNDRDAVRKAIRTAIEKISKKDSSLAVHLRNSVQLNDLIQYRPERSPSWEL